MSDNAVLDFVVGVYTRECERRRVHFLTPPELAEGVGESSEGLGSVEALRFAADVAEERGHAWIAGRTYINGKPETIPFNALELRELADRVEREQAEKAKHDELTRQGPWRRKSNGNIVRWQRCNQVWGGRYVEYVDGVVPGPSGRYGHSEIYYGEHLGTTLPDDCEPLVPRSPHSFVRTCLCGVELLDRCEPLKFVPDEVVQAARVLRRYIEQQEKPDPITEVIEKFRTQGVD